MRKYLQIAPFVFDCKYCPTPCNGVSKFKYNFEEDLRFSEHYEQSLINYINQFTYFRASKATEKGYPDLEVTDKKGRKFYIEVKVQRRTFMTVENALPKSGLKPSETLALNLSDLLRYFDLEESTGCTIFIFWILLDRPCILKGQETKFYYRLVSELKLIWQKEGDKRRFRRKSGGGDEVNGQHLGVTVNYHFSLSELKQWRKKHRV
jgi:hypothetical protein